MVTEQAQVTKPLGNNRWLCDALKRPGQVGVNDDDVARFDDMPLPVLAAVMLEPVVSVSAIVGNRVQIVKWDAVVGQARAGVAETPHRLDMVTQRVLSPTLGMRCR